MLQKVVWGAYFMTLTNSYDRETSRFPQVCTAETTSIGKEVGPYHSPVHEGFALLSCCAVRTSSRIHMYIL